MPREKPSPISSGVSTKQVISRPPSGVGVFAKTVMKLAKPPFVIQIFWPLRMKCSPSSVGSAVVRSAAGSEPASGSVSA